MSATKSAQRKEKMADDTSGSLSTKHIFRGIEYIVSMFLRGELVIVEVEDKLTADQWRGEFDARYIEDLTHKTGNFKQFKVFVNMLESALHKDSSSVGLDLLTYGDLQNLRNQEPGAPTTSIPAARAMSQLATKRYLILTYTVEFDRIHYPLPLPYVGQPDPVHLQDINRKLKDEIKNLKNQLTKEAKSLKAGQKQKRLNNLMNEKENLEKEYGEFQREVKHSGLADTAKEIKVLKKVIKNFEGELLKEKTKYQRMLSKKTQENRDVLEELKEARANERNLRARCRSLTNELAMLKRQGVKIRQSPSAVPRTSSATKKQNYIPRRSASQERKITPQTRRRTRSPSPGAPVVPRFDPTAYVKEKQRKLKETKEGRSRKRTHSGQSNIGRRRSLSSDRGSDVIRSRPQEPNRIYRTSSLSSIGSRRSSGSARGQFSDHEKSRRRSGPQRRPRTRGSDASSVDASDAEGRKKYSRKIYSSTPDGVRRPPSALKRGRDVLENSLNRSVEMSEIDARLNALQQFMKDNMR